MTYSDELFQQRNIENSLVAVKQGGNVVPSCEVAGHLPEKFE